MFNTLQKIVRQHLGIEHVLEVIFDKIGDIEKIYLLGDSARGIDSGLIEILIIGSNIDTNFLEEISLKIEKIINRKVKFCNEKLIEDKFDLLIYNAQ